LSPVLGVENFARNRDAKLAFDFSALSILQVARPFSKS